MTVKMHVAVSGLVTKIDQTLPLDDEISSDKYCRTYFSYFELKLQEYRGTKCNGVVQLVKIMHFTDLDEVT